MLLTHATQYKCNADTKADRNLFHLEQRSSKHELLVHAWMFQMAPLNKRIQALECLPLMDPYLFFLLILVACPSAKGGNEKLCVFRNEYTLPSTIRTLPTYQTYRDNKRWLFCHFFSPMRTWWQCRLSLQDKLASTWCRRGLLIFHLDHLSHYQPGPVKQFSSTPSKPTFVTKVPTTVEWRTMGRRHTTTSIPPG